MATTITQGKTFTDTGGRTGVAQFNPNTGAPLSAGQSVGVNPVSGAASNPISKGQTITDTQGRTGTAAFDQNTGAPLQDGQKVVTKSPQGVQSQGLGNIQSSSNPVNQNPVTSPSTAIVPQPLTPNPDKYKTAFSTLTQNGTPAPQDAGAARSQIQNALPQNQDMPAVEAALAASPEYQDKLKLYTEHFNPEKQTTSLIDQYKQFRSDLGVDNLNTEIINAKKIIDGTEFDIRNEIQAAGGTGTDSQIQAMALSRNRQMLINYNTLVSTRDQAMTELNTMSGLAAQDRQYAISQFDSQTKFLDSMATFRQNATNNIKEGLNNVVTKYGYSGLYSMYKDQPTQLAGIEKVLGLAPGGLAKTAGMQTVTPGRYKDSISTITDAFGNQSQIVRVFDTTTGQFVNGSGSTGGSVSGNSTGTGNGSSSGNFTPSTPSSGLKFEQYGNLAKTTYNPGNTVDNIAAKYLDQYIKNGSVPTASSLGRNMKPGALAQVDARARELYFQATGTPLPDPKIIQGYRAQLIGNNKLLNNLSVQEGTIGKNAALLIQNLKANNLNQNAQPINSFIDGVKNMLGDPDVAQFLAQNATVGNELGSLLSLKNAQGTTVHDKLEAAGIINKNDSEAQITSKINVLLQEAVNAHDAIQSANGELYKQTDPLLQDANNPARTQTINQTKVDNLLNNYSNPDGSKGLSYNSLIASMSAQTPPGHQPAIDATTGTPVFATPEEIRSGKYIPL